jgi:hypothetical protein
MTSRGTPKCIHVRSLARSLARSRRGPRKLPLGNGTPGSSWKSRQTAIAERLGCFYASSLERLEQRRLARG